MSNLFFIDFETGGLNHWYNAVCSVNIQDLGEYNQTLYFYPQKRVYEYQALQVNGLDMKTLYENGSSREVMINQINHLYENQSEKYLILAGWNVMFDIQFLLNIYKEKNLNLPCPVMALDLKQIAEENIKKKDKRKKEDDGVENHKLTTIYQHFFDDFEEDKAHTADYDVMMCKKLFYKFVKLEWLSYEL